MHIAFSHPLWLLALLAGPAALTGRARLAALIAAVCVGTSGTWLYRLQREEGQA